MARTVPGSGAEIKPIFDKLFGVRAVEVINPGSGYDPEDPPRLTVTGCGTPSEECLLYPIIDGPSGKIVHVRVLSRGRGYDPLRLNIIPSAETTGVVDSFDINRIWQSHPNSLTSGTFQSDTDRLRIVSDNDPKPADIFSERSGGAGLIADRSFDQTFIYRGGKQVPFGQNRPFQKNKSLGIMANGTLLHTPEWGNALGNAPEGFELDTVYNDNPKNTDVYDGIIDNQTYYYQSSKLVEHFKTTHGVLDWGLHEVFTWYVKTELDNVLLTVSGIDEVLNPIEVGRTVLKIGDNSVSGEIAKIIRDDNNIITSVYVRQVTGVFTVEDRILGSTGFSFTVSAEPRAFPSGIFYIDFGEEAHEFGNFIPGVYYLSPENIQVQQNYVIIWNQDDPSNQVSAAFPLGHPMQFSTTQDGILNSGTLYYNSTGASGALGTDYENPFRSIFIMNADESNRIYYYCKNHRYMSGYAGHEGYMVLNNEIEDEEPENNYYIRDYYNEDIVILPDDIQTQYTGSLSSFQRITIEDSGSGTGSTGGFDIGRHIVFGRQSGNRQLRLYLDLRNVSTLTFEVIRGSDSNGGENPDGNAESLRVFFGGTAYGSSVLVAYNNSNFNTLNNVTISIPPDSRKENQLVYVYQFSNSGTNFDSYGLKSITYGGGEQDLSRHPDGHSKILGMSFDGYPIYGPYGYFGTNNSVVRASSSYRLKSGIEVDGARPEQVAAETVTYAVTVSNNKFLYDATSPSFLNLKRGKTYVFNQDDSSNDGNILLLSTAEDGWHPTSDVEDISNKVNLYEHPSITYTLNGSSVSYDNYVSGFTTATTRSLSIAMPSDSPRVLNSFSYANASYGVRTVQDGYAMGSLYQDYIYDETEGTLDEHNGVYISTPEYPNGTYAYFLTEDSSGNPTFPYCVGPTYFGTPLFEGDDVPDLATEVPTIAEGNVVLEDDGTVSYIQMTKTGDGYFSPAVAQIIGGEGSGATASPVVQSVTGLTLLNEGKSFATPPTLIFEGGGGQGAQGAASISSLGKVTSINIIDEGDFYQTSPYILIDGGGGQGAKAIANINQGVITSIDILDQGGGYVNPPNIIFTKLINLKRTTKARQSFNSAFQYLTGLTKDIDASSEEIFVSSTDAFPGSGTFLLNNEIVTYTGKTRGKFTGLTRGTNFNYDQRIILDTSQDVAGISNYNFNVGDRVIRRVETASSKIAKVYDWRPSTRELFVTFEVDELAFIDAGIASTEDAIVQFNAGLPDSAGGSALPHTTEVSIGSQIFRLQLTGITVAPDIDFVDIAENDGAGDGIPDLSNTGTDYENQISLDGGIYNSLYGIEETQGGTNTTLFAIGDNILDATPFPEQKFATVSTAGGLSEGVEHSAQVKITLDKTDGNGQNYGVNEIVTGDLSGVTGTVVSWDTSTGILVVQSITPFNTGNVNIGVNGFLNEFSAKSSIVDIVVQEPGTNYSAPPTVVIENAGDIQSTAVAVMTVAGDQVSSVTISNGGYGYKQEITTNILHPTITFTNDASDTTGSGAVAYAILGGEKIAGSAGASYRIKNIEYQTVVQTS